MGLEMTNLDWQPGSMQKHHGSTPKSVSMRVFPEDTPHILSWGGESHCERGQHLSIARVLHCVPKLWAGPIFLLPCLLHLDGLSHQNPSQSQLFLDSVTLVRVTLSQKWKKWLIQGWTHSRLRARQYPVHWWQLVSCDLLISQSERVRDVDMYMKLTLLLASQQNKSRVCLAWCPSRAAVG